MLLMIEEDIVIIAEDVYYKYPDGIDALNGITFSVRRGESVCISGPNGAGKSTLLLLIAGIFKPSSGKIKVITDGGGIGLVFQDPDNQLFCSTVYEDVAFGPRNQGFSEEEIKRKVNIALSSVGLKGYEMRSSHHLSGGEKKRVAIASVLSMCPLILAMDEPWAEMDKAGSDAITEIISGFNGTKLIVSQDLFRAAEVCHRLIIVHSGRVVWDGKMEDAFRLYLEIEKYGVDLHSRCKFCSTRRL